MEFAKELIKILESKKQWLPISDSFSYFIDFNDLVDIALSLEQEQQFNYFNKEIENINKQHKEIMELIKNVRNN